MIRGMLAAGCLVSLMAFAPPLAAQTPTPAQTKPKAAPTPAELATPDVSLEMYRAKYLAKVGPITKAKLPGIVAQVKARADAKAKPGEPPVDLVVVARETSWAVLGAMPDGTIEAMTYLVLMEAAKSAQEDVRDVMAKVNAINETKKCLRDPLCRAGVRKKYEPVIGKAAMDEILAADAKAINDQANLEATRLQMFADRAAKVREALSNVWKKLTATSDQIVANMK